MMTAMVMLKVLRMRMTMMIMMMMTQMINVAAFSINVVDREEALRAVHAVPAVL